jgi:K+ transporter
MFVWRLSPFIVFLPWLTIALMDGTFLSSALTKVPDGAWFTLTLAIVLGAIFMLWRFGKEQVNWSFFSRETRVVKSAKCLQTRHCLCHPVIIPPHKLQVTQMHPDA